MNNEELVLSNESGFQGDWKTIYHRDALLWASHEYDTDSIMKPLAQMVIGLANQFNLSPTIEFTTIDTLELLLVRAFQSWMQSPVTFPDTVEQQKDAFLRQLPMYVVAVFDIVAKYSNLGSKLDLAAMKRAAKVSVAIDTNMLTVEFEVIKILDSELRSSLLLGAFERFSKQYLLPLNIESKETIASIGVRLLRVAVAERALIYDSLKTSMKDMECFRRFKSNKLILAGAIILTVLYLVPAARHSSVLLNQVAVPLADDCCVQSTNLIYLRDAILRVIGGH
uniref:NR LBD domain-containing protein n=1 Tax=Anopheles coluzzii TaxID=1518534 RepID=A0A6E8VTZ9_ANOCL